MDNFMELGAVTGTTYGRYFRSKFAPSGEPSEHDLEKYAKNPQQYVKELSSLAKYYYFSEGMIMRTVNIIRDYALTDIRLDYKESKAKVKNIVEALMDRVDIKQFCKDFIFEMAMTGNCFCYDREGQFLDIYPLDMIEVSNVIVNGKQQVYFKNDTFEVDFDVDPEEERLKAKAYPPEITRGIQSNKEKILFNVENSYFSKMNSSRYDRYGISFLVPAFGELSAKNLLKQAERSTASGFIDQILHIKVGDKDHDKVSHKDIQYYSSIFDGKKGALRITTPYWVEASWVTPESTIFGEEKFFEIDKDLLSALGVSLTLLRGEGGGNYSEGVINMSGLIRTIESIRQPLIPILESIFARELERNGIKGDKAPKVSFNEIVIDQNSKLEIVQWLFEHAGLPYRVLFEEHGYDFDSLKLERIEENKGDEEEVFKLRDKPNNGNFIAKMGQPKKNISERKSDVSYSNNDAPRPGQSRVID